MLVAAFQMPAAPLLEALAFEGIGIGVAVTTWMAPLESTVVIGPRLFWFNPGAAAPRPAAGTLVAVVEVVTAGLFVTTPLVVVVEAGVVIWVVTLKVWSGTIPDCTSL